MIVLVCGGRTYGEPVDHTDRRYNLRRLQREHVFTELDVFRNTKVPDLKIVNGGVTGQPDCQDPAKAEFTRAVMDRLDAIEAKLGMR